MSAVQAGAMTPGHFRAIATADLRRVRQRSPVAKSVTAVQGKKDSVDEPTRLCCARLAVHPRTRVRRRQITVGNLAFAPPQGLVEARSRGDAVGCLRAALPRPCAQCAASAA
jgi:hypothetical protein